MENYKYRNNNHAFVLFPSVVSPVERITGVWLFSRPSQWPSSCRSLPGHLIHIVTKGSYRLRTDGREYDIRVGDVIYYYQSEEVEWLGNKTSVQFYSVGFDASLLSPPPLDTRVLPGNRVIQKAFETLYSSSLQAEPIGRRLAMHASLLQVLLEVHRLIQTRTEVGRDVVLQDNLPQVHLWWRIEQEVRQKRRFRLTLEDLADSIGSSRATVYRACKTATGQSPIQRLRALRMAEAKGLLLFSIMNVSQIAEYLGYPRVHEFSREYHRYFGHPPSTTR